MPKQSDPTPDTRTRLLDAAMHVVRLKGYNATTVQDICDHAGITKGGFFHYFRSKQDLAVATAGHFCDMAHGLFEQAPYHAIEDPLDRLLGYIDFRIAIMTGTLPQYSCLLGTMVQETYETQPLIREACARGITTHAQCLADLIEEARQHYAPDADWSAQSLAMHTQGVIQGALILAKAQHGPEAAIDSLRHLRRYVALLFGLHTAQAKQTVDGDVG